MDDAAALAELRRRPDRAGLLLDVDGTLAPIVPRPDEARVPDETRFELVRLRDRYALVACISGRSSDDAHRVVGVDGLVYVGEHGLELAPEAERWGPVIRDFGARAGWPAEQKRLSVSFHYRQEADASAAVGKLERIAEQALAEGLRPRWGRKVLEVRPPLDADKRTAVIALIARHDLRCALYAGDDATDLDGFRGLDGLACAVRVAVVSEEAPSELGEAADVRVEGPAALLELLRTL